jgi:hypothetical protein
VPADDQDGWTGSEAIFIAIGWSQKASCFGPNTAFSRGVAFLSLICHEHKSRETRKLSTTYVARAGNFIEKTECGKDLLNLGDTGGLLVGTVAISPSILVPTRNVSTNQRDKIREGLLMTAKILSG